MSFESRWQLSTESSYSELQTACNPNNPSISRATMASSMSALLPPSVGPPDCTKGWSSGGQHDVNVRVLVIVDYNIFANTCCIGQRHDLGSTDMNGA